MKSEGARVRKLIFLVFFIGLFLVVARLFYPFLSVVLWSSLVYAILEPLQRRLLHEKKQKPRNELVRSIVAGFFALTGVLVIVVPLFFLGIALIKQGGELAADIRHALEANPNLLDLSPEGTIGGFFYRISDGAIRLPRLHLKNEILKFLTARSGALIGISGIILKDAATLILSLAFMVFTLFFLFMDGRNLLETLINAVPMESFYTSLFIRKLRDTGRQLLVGYFLVAVFQGAMMFLICIVFRVKAPLFMASLTAIASFVPMLGTALVWMPAAASIMLAGDITRGVLMLAASAIFVAVLDNFIRPILLRERLKIHPLLIFFAILGGLKLFGFNGLLLGPLILMLFFTAADLYDKIYERSPDPDADPSAAKHGPDMSD